MKEGYRDWVFFPLYPMAIRAASVVTFGDLSLAAILVSNVSFLAAMATLYALSRRHLDHERSIRAVTYLAIAPGAVAFAMAYGESLFLLLSVGAFLAAEHRRWAAMGFLCALAALTRLPGVLLVIPLLVLQWQTFGRPRLPMAWLALGPLALVGFMAYQGVAIGDPLGFLTAQRAWDIPPLISSETPASSTALFSPLPWLLIGTLLGYTFLFVFMRVDRIRLPYVVYAVVAVRARSSPLADCSRSLDTSRSPSHSTGCSQTGARRGSWPRGRSSLSACSRARPPALHDPGPVRKNGPTISRARRWVDRPPFDSPWVRAWLAKWLWPVWLTIWSVSYLIFLISASGSFGFDVRIYHLAAQAWLDGGDPWLPTIWASSRSPAVHFAGPPPTLLPFALVAWAPVEYVSVVVVLALAAIALWVLRRLGLPPYWLLFPPILQSVWVGNLNIAVIALLLAGTSVAAGIATLMKAYALIPLLIAGRFRALAASMLLVAATLPFLPWGIFLSKFSDITQDLASQSWMRQGDALTSPLAFVGAAGALVLLGRERASWLAVPVLLPATQLHYSVLALPVFATVPFLAFAGAVPVPGVLGVGVMVFALWERRATIAALWAGRRRGVSEQP